jgi:hypothetical protein
VQLGCDLGQPGIREAFLDAALQRRTGRHDVTDVQAAVHPT